MCIDTARPWPEIPGTGSVLTWPNTLSSSDSETVCCVSISHYISAPGLREEVNYGVTEMLSGGNVTVDSDTILMIVFPFKYFRFHQEYLTHCENCIGVGLPGIFGLRWQCLDETPSVSNCRLWWIFRWKGSQWPVFADYCPGLFMTLAAPVAGVMTMWPGDTVADTGGPVDNERGSHRDWSDPAIIYYPTLTVGILHKSLRSHRPPPSPSRGAELSVMVRRYTGNCF